MKILFLITLTAFCVSVCSSYKAKRLFACGSSTVLTQDNGEITSHAGFDNNHNYGKNLNCTWIIQAPVGMYVELVAESFNVEDDPSCSFDYLKLYDGNSTAAKAIGEFCGRTFNPISSTGRYITLEFVTDDSTQLSGFKIFYNFTSTIIHSCHGHRFACDNGNCIQQAFRCDGDDDCFDDSDEKNCPAFSCPAGNFACADKQCIANDWLCDGDDDCGNGEDELPANCQGGTGPTTIPLGQGSSPQCGMLNFTGLAGSIQSPNYPGNYPDRTFCLYQIFAPAGSKNIAYKFDGVFYLEGTGQLCSYDYVTIYSDGHSFTHGPFCGNVSPGQFTLPSTHAIIEFSSDDSDNYQGFKLDWKVIDIISSKSESKRFIAGPSNCDFYINITHPGSILSPNYGNGNYPHEIICTWRLAAPQGKVIRLHFNQFSLELSRHCMRDNLRIFDGVASSSDVIGQFCGRSIPNDVVSTNSEILVFFFSDSSFEDLGFNITYSLQNATARLVIDPNDGCHGSTKVFTAPSGIITSPGYDGLTPYENDVDCSWIIEAPAGKSVTIKFHDFLTEKIDGCTYDYLVIYDGQNNNSRKIEQICGLQFPDDVTSSGRYLLLRFISDADVSGSGFNLTYSFHQFTPQCPNFLCGDGSCIFDTMVCNKIQECPDASDEAVCVSSQCGKPAIPPLENNRKIVGGREATANSWPWMVSLRVNQTHTCGGALISDSWILTAGHCFESHRQTSVWTVAAGKHYDIKPNPHLQVRQVTTIIVNSNYDSGTSNNDIALVKVEPAFQLNMYVSSICLPTQPPRTGHYCYITGWGYIENTCCPDVLKQAEIPIISRSLCNQPDHLSNQVTENMFCAGYEKGGVDACQGDSGGPFVCKHGSSWHIQGVTSFGSGCADAKSPGVYTQVYNYLDWIHQKVAIN